MKNIRGWTAVGMLAAGVGLSTAGFIAPPLGEISDSVLWFTAQCLMYAGSALGIDVIVDRRVKSLDKPHQTSPNGEAQDPEEGDGAI